MVAQDSPLPESGESWATTLSGSRESWATTLQSQNFSHERKKHTRAIRKKLLLIKVNPKNNFSFVENYPQKDHLFLFSVVTTNL